MMRVALLLLIVFLNAVTCSCASAPAKPGCAESDLARINAAEQGELAMQCAGAGVNCPDRKAIHADYKARREAWFLRCSDDSSREAGQ